MNRFSPDTYHEKMFAELKPELAFKENADYDAWKQAVKEKLTELLGESPVKVPLNVQIEWELNHDTFREIRFTYDTEPDMSVPCHLLIPHNAKKPCPVVICLQGHTTGMHRSMGRMQFERDEKETQYERENGSQDRDFALQAVEEGLAALCIEQRGLGERISEKSLSRNSYYRTTCHTPSMAALLLGRTMIGERVWDVSRAIDALSEFKEIDINEIGCMGNSGGGTATYYAACMEERIKIAMPSCSVCTFEESIGTMHHCVCNFIPKMAKYFDMGDIACLIAPRKLVVVSGMTDVGFLIKGSMDAYKTIEAVYKKAGCPDNCKQVVGEGGHRFYKNPAWKVFKELAGWN